MKTNLRQVASLVVVFLLGYAIAHWEGAVSSAQGVKPAYLVASLWAPEPDKLGPYRDAGRPLAEKVGMEVLGRASGSTLQLLEGEWPYKGQLLLEKYDSMDALLGFWNSPEYQAAKKLREGLLNVDFIIAFEGSD